MAAILTLIMTGVIWVAVVLSVFVFVVLAIGLVASLNDGALSIPAGRAATAEVGPLDFVFPLIGLAIVAPGVVYVCVQLRRILATLADGDPFVPENAARLTRVAVALAIMEVASLLSVITMHVVPQTGSVARDHPITINLVVWAAVAALLILSQVFREGTRLREEEKMTI